MINKVLDIIALIYHFAWYKVFQRREPLTPQFCRLEQAYPLVFWSVGIALCALLGANLGDSFWQSVVYILILAFLVWFFPHVLRYRIDHPENKPNFVRWADKRLKAKRGN